MCEFCGEQRSVVYCRSDAASLCLSCDRNVHSANALSQRHSRTLLCERCTSQPSVVRCAEERISLCQNCDWAGHPNNSSHKRQAVSCYSGCPSAAQLSTIWSFLLDFPSVGDSTCEQGMGSMSITDSHHVARVPEGGGSEPTVNLLPNRVGASLETIDKKLHAMELPIGSTYPSSPKVCNPGTKEPRSVFEDDDFCGDFNVDENYEELFGMSFNDPENQGIDDLFETEDFAHSSCKGVSAVEVALMSHCPSIYSSSHILLHPNLVVYFFLCWDTRNSLSTYFIWLRDDDELPKVPLKIILCLKSIRYVLWTILSWLMYGRGHQWGDR
ncbi:unnamed protein product [Cuscuta campestris]|uniref:B box-type domain-containing protein n=1 Tax=Cuscuta campestris TaxID=132261 RepID=A0A484MSP5_9ASTE|nr:unnamed protein product [Cuscuta campestris]